MKTGPPSRLGPYQIVGPLGTGGMGEVYRAKDARLQREVAVKILPESAASNPERHRRFAQEAIAAGSLNHPNILVVYDVGVEQDTPYLVSELVDGAPLRHEMARGRVALKRLLDIGLQIAEGLTAAHDAGIVHRDLKPENVMLTPDGRVKILDFGLAKVSGGDDSEAAQVSGLTETADGLLLGTVPYMSPEQAQGARVDFRSDQFSLGVILSEMATGSHPFRRETTIQTLSAIIGDEPPDIANVVPALPVSLRWLLQRLLAKNPRDRYAHTADLAADLRNIRDHLTEAASGLAVQVSARPVRRDVRLAIGALVLAIAAFAVGRIVTTSRTDLAAYRFTPLATDAGYQGAPAFSPDGKTIAYVAEIDGIVQVFTRSLASSGRSQVTRSRFDCRDPFWAPDGRRIYYHSAAGYDDALWQVSVAGGRSEVLIEHSTAAAISPDGRTLVLIRPSADAARVTLWFSSPPGTDPKRYTRAPVGDGELDDGYFRFSPDGSKLLMWLMRDAPGPSHEAPQTGFWMMPIPDGAPQLVMPSLAGPRAPPLFSWFPDNRHIVMVRSDGRTPGGHLWVVDTKTDVAEPLTITNGNEGSPAVAPDGNTIALTSEATDFDLVMVPTDGSEARSFLSSTRNEMDPAWSPVRPEYAYVTDRTGTPEIWLRSEEGTWEKPLVTDRDFDGSRTIALGALAFSPDGQRLAYQRYSTEGYRIWISSIAGGSPVQLTAKGYEDAPTWSPDGEWIAFYGLAQKGVAKVRVGEAATGAVVLKAGTHIPMPVRWSPEGRFILWQQAEGLLLISADGKESRILSEDNWLAYDWAADGRTIYGLQPTEDLHHFMLVSADVATGRTRVLNTNLGTIPQANQPIRGFSRVRNSAFLTSIARVRSDVWLLQGFPPTSTLLDRLWPFRGGRTPAASSQP